MPIDPLTASAVISAVPALYQAGSGIVQSITGKKLRSKRPKYNIPGEAFQNLNDATSAYNASTAYGLPGQGRIQNNLLQSQASAQQGIMQSQQSPSAQLLGLTAVNANTNRTMADLGINSAQFRQQNMNQMRAGMMSAREALARYRDREFELNKLNPFMDEMYAKGALRGSSMQNVYGGLTSLANTAGQFINRQSPSTTTPTTTPIATGQGGLGAQGRERIVQQLLQMGVPQEEIDAYIR